MKFTLEHSDANGGTYVKEYEFSNISPLGVFYILAITLQVAYVMVAQFEHNLLVALVVSLCVGTITTLITSLTVA